MKAHYNSFWTGLCFTRLQHWACLFQWHPKQPHKCRAAKMLIKPNHLTIHRRHCVVNNAVSVAWLQGFIWKKTVYFCLVCALGHKWRRKSIKKSALISWLTHLSKSGLSIFFVAGGVQSNCVLPGRHGQFYTFEKLIMKVSWGNKTQLRWIFLLLLLLLFFFWFHHYIHYPGGKRRLPFLSPKNRVCCAGFDHWREVLSLKSTRQVILADAPSTTVTFWVMGNWPWLPVEI